MTNYVIVTAKEVRATHRKNPAILAEVMVEIAIGQQTILIDDIRVLNGKKGLWAAMPSYTTSAGGKDYVYHPTVTISAGLLGQLETEVLSAYQAWAKKNGPVVNAHGLEVSADDIGF